VIDVTNTTQSELYQTIGLKLRADQSPNGAAFRRWAGSTIATL
jgi:hypothetical protein